MAPRMEPPLVKDIVPGGSNSLPRNFFRVGTKLLFSASDGVNGEELWSTEGTEAGTVLVKDTWPVSRGRLEKARTILSPVQLGRCGSHVNHTRDRRRS